jgi:glycerophosphoryl diester phosphodiesterase
LWTLVILLVPSCRRELQASPLPCARSLPRAHSHNDYQHPRPLLDALALGYTSVEADVCLVDGTFYVTHDCERVVPERTLEGSYLRPLQERVQASKAACASPFQLLIDVKSEASASYRALDTLLQRYRDMLTAFTPTGSRPGAITVVISGNRDRAQMLAQTQRFAGYDGRASDLDAAAPPPGFMPLVSAAWTDVFHWQGQGSIPAAEREALLRMVQIAHTRGQQIRFWATPEAADLRENAWRELAADGVDFLNSDAIDALQGFVRRRGRAEPGANPSPN